MHVTTCIFLLRMMNVLMHVARHRPIAAGGVRREPTTRFHRQVGCLLYRLRRAISGRLYDDRALTTDPGDNCWPVFVIMTPAGLVFLAATTCAASQRLLPSLLRLPLVASGMVAVIGFDGTLQLTMHLRGQRGIAQPPASPI